MNHILGWLEIYLPASSASQDPNPMVKAVKVYQVHLLWGWADEPDER